MGRTMIVEAITVKIPRTSMRNWKRDMIGASTDGNGSRFVGHRGALPENDDCA
jgi:hypothetical protein